MKQEVSKLVNAGVLFQGVTVAQAKLYARVSFYERQGYRVLSVPDKTTICLGRPKGKRETFWTGLHLLLDRRFKGNRTPDKYLPRSYQVPFSTSTADSSDRPSLRAFSGLFGTLAISQILLLVIYFSPLAVDFQPRNYLVFPTETLEIQPYLITAIGLLLIILSGWIVRNIVRDLLVTVLDGKLFDRIELSLEPSGKVVEKTL